MINIFRKQSLKHDCILSTWRLRLQEGLVNFRTTKHDMSFKEKKHPKWLHAHKTLGLIPGITKLINQLSQIF